MSIIELGNKIFMHLYISFMHRATILVVLEVFIPKEEKKVWGKRKIQCQGLKHNFVSFKYKDITVEMSNVTLG